MEHVGGFDIIILPGKESYSRNKIEDIPETDLPRFYEGAYKYAVESL